MKKAEFFLATIFVIFSYPMFAQTDADTLMQISLEVRNFEQKILLTTGTTGIIDGFPSTLWKKGSVTIVVQFSDAEKTKPNFIFVSDGKRNWLDKGIDGFVDVYLIDKGSPKDMVPILKCMVGHVDPIMLKHEGKYNGFNYAMLNFLNMKLYATNTDGGSTIELSVVEKENFQKNSQRKLLETLNNF